MGAYISSVQIPVLPVDLTGFLKNLGPPYELEWMIEKGAPPSFGCGVEGPAHGRVSDEVFAQIRKGGFQCDVIYRWDSSSPGAGTVSFLPGSFGFEELPDMLNDYLKAMG